MKDAEVNESVEVELFRAGKNFDIMISNYGK